jgi:hypothetical protein
MVTGSDYDGDVQMFVQRPREVNLACLRFLRWLAVRGSLEHPPAGRPNGVYARDDLRRAESDAARPASAGAPECSD